MLIVIYSVFTVLCKHHQVNCDHLVISVNEIFHSLLPLSNRPIAKEMASSTTPRKRKADDDEDIKAAREALKAKMEEIEIPEGTPMNQTPNQIRNQIRRIIESGEIGIGAFCDTIGVSTNSYRRFMGQNGTHGSESDCYFKAWEYFEKRKQAGVRGHLVPKRAKTDNKKTTGADGGGPSTTEEFDVAAVTLDGEAEDNVKVYDTCDEIRRKIGAHLRRVGVTRAQFCRDLSAQIHQNGPKVFSARMLTAFQNKKGPTMGATSLLFYAAYVFFEKKRIHEKKSKTKHRQEMERVWGNKGFDRKFDGSQPMFVHESERVFVTQYGQHEFQKMY